MTINRSIVVSIMSALDRERTILVDYTFEPGQRARTNCLPEDATPGYGPHVIINQAWMLHWRKDGTWGQKEMGTFFSPGHLKEITQAVFDYENELATEAQESHNATRYERWLEYRHGGRV